MSKIKKINFNDFRKRYFSNKKDIDATISRVLKSGYFILGEELNSFEKKLAKFLKVNYAIGVNSGTDAIFLSLKVLGVGSGDEVITVANTATPTVSAIRMTGAKPVFVDINDNSYNINSNFIESKISKHTKVILPVHLYGYPAEMDRIVKIAKKYKLFIVEDAAQAIGAKFKKQFAGTFGDLGCLSFYPTKNLGAFGDAGAVVTNNKKLYLAIKKLRNYGESKKYQNEIEGVNSRLDEIQAALLNWGINKLITWNKRREKLANIYLKNLAGLPIKLPKARDKECQPVWHLFVISAKQRDKLQKYLEKFGVKTSVHYPIPIFQQKAYKFLKIKPTSLPVTNKMAKHILSLPIYPELKKEEVLYISKMIKKFYGK